jgi:hypothetical protein
MAQAAIIPIHHQVNVWAIRKGLMFHMRMQEGTRAWDIEQPIFLLPLPLRGRG